MKSAGAGGAADRSKLFKSLPDSIPELVAQFDRTTTSGQDQLVITSIDFELKQAGLKWFDLGNLLRFQLAAHRRCTVTGFVNATLAHPNKARLTEWEVNFLRDIAGRKFLLSEKQLACVQSIADSLDLTEGEWTSRPVQRHFSTQ